MFLSVGEASASVIMDEWYRFSSHVVITIDTFEKRLDKFMDSKDGVRFTEAALHRLTGFLQTSYVLKSRKKCILAPLIFNTCMN